MLYFFFWPNNSFCTFSFGGYFSLSTWRSANGIKRFFRFFYSSFSLLLLLLHHAYYCYCQCSPEHTTLIFHKNIFLFPYILFNCVCGKLFSDVLSLFCVSAFAAFFSFEGLHRSV